MSVRKNEWHETKAYQELICEYYRGHELASDKAISVKCDLTDGEINFSVQVHLAEPVKFLSIKANQQIYIK